MAADSTGSNPDTQRDGCVVGEGIAVCYGPPMRELKREAWGERWCFICRKRREFTLTISVPTEPSYYGPSYVVRCDRGHFDGDVFPGCSREWSEE